MFESRRDISNWIDYFGSGISCVQTKLEYALFITRQTVNEGYLELIFNPIGQMKVNVRLRGQHLGCFGQSTYSILVIQASSIQVVH